MAEPRETPQASQSHNSSPALAGLQQLWEEPVSRMTGLVEEMARLEGKALEQFRVGIEESARLAKETLAYFANLSAQLRKIALDSMRQGAERFSATATTVTQAATQAAAAVQSGARA